MTMYVACELATGSKYWSAYQLWCVGANRCRRCLHLTQNMPKCECGQACSTDARCLASVKSTQPMITAALIFVFFYFWSDFFRIPGTLYSWIKYMSLEDWVAQRFNFNAPPAYLQMLKDHTLWITKQGALRKDQKPFQIFPKLIIHGFFVEFKDCIYIFFDGTTIPLQNVQPNTATLCHVNSNFDQCRPPYNILGLLHTWGKQ